ncbi:MAG: channel protein [Pseudomonadota bacterium]|jgi:type IV secretion system protein VirB8
MSQDGLRDYIESGKYFKDSIAWYGDKYLSPSTYRVWICYAVMLLLVMLIALLSTVNKLLPIKQQVRYTIFTDSNFRGPDKAAQIIEMDSSSRTTPSRFVAAILLKNYINNREQYDYDKLKSQYSQVENASTRLVFKRFDNSMRIDNPDSPVIKYQKFAKRSVTITHIEFISDAQANIDFNSITRDDSSNVLEDSKWRANVSFDMGDVKRKFTMGDRFEFTVTDYKLTLLGDNNAK